MNRMERDGLVERVADPDDQRSRLISLTPAAARKMPKAKALLDARTVEALDGFSAAEADQLTALLQRLNTNLDRMEGGEGEPVEPGGAG
jgi:MarR family transcriptional regulator, transcriptional regulator for hemolysin